MSLSNRQQLLIGIILGLVMIVTRNYHFGSITHLPDASWAVFFLAGMYLRPLMALPIFFGLAGFIDYAAITWGGTSSFCVTSAYAFLVLAYGALWFAGRTYAHFYKWEWQTLLPLMACVLVGAVFCELLSGGSFYLLSDYFAQPTMAEYAMRFMQYFPAYLQTLAIYLASAMIVHVGCKLAVTRTAYVDNA